MAHDIVHGLDSMEIFDVQRMLTAGLAPNRYAEIIRQAMHHRIQNRNTGNFQVLAFFLQFLTQLIVDHREDHGAGMFLYTPQRYSKGVLAANHRPKMFDNLDILELRETSARYPMGCFAGGVGDEMKMKSLQPIYTFLGGAVGITAPIAIFRANDPH